jgi:predicted negative regulator of RcsB-dependent stress response
MEVTEPLRVDRHSAIYYIVRFITFEKTIPYHKNYQEENCMASESVFDKKLTAETNMDKVEGLLEHLNLPPKAIDFIRLHQRMIQITLAAVVVAVVCWSLYGSYRERITEEAATALSTALEADQAMQPDKLRAVAENYSSTSSALWARIELAHLDMNKGAFGDASKQYEQVLADLKASDPAYPLVLFGLAQSLEADKRLAEAAAQYDLLKSITGYELIGYAGMARLEQEQGNIDKAITILNNFLLFMGDDPVFAQAQQEITAKIARLKARQ